MSKPLEGAYRRAMFCVYLWCILSLACLWLICVSFFKVLPEPKWYVVLGPVWLFSTVISGWAIVAVKRKDNT